MMTRLTVFALFTACSSPPAPVHPDVAKAPLSFAADDRMVIIPAGRYVAGSTPEERQAAYETSRVRRLSPHGESRWCARQRLVR
jgi:hypothetical protein